MKKIMLAIAICMALTLCACNNTAKPTEKETTSGEATAAVVASDTDTNDEITTVPDRSDATESADSTPSTTKPDESTTQPEKTDNPAESTKPAETTSQKTSVPTQNPSKSTEQTKPTLPYEPPASSEPRPSQPTAQYATSADETVIADKVVAYINSFRSSPATKLPGLTKYAEYRSRQLITNFAHDTDDERAAATALKYGEYVVPSEWGMTGEPYYTANSGEAIGKAGYAGTVDYVARKLAEGFRNSEGHWAYLGDSKYAYIAVGVSYDNGLWYCDVAVALENTDNL